MKKYIMFLWIASIVNYVYSQNYTFKKNTVYLEFLGSGVLGSVNYERQIFQKPGLGVRVGASVIFSEQKKLQLPVGVNYLIHLSKNKSYLDIGFNMSNAISMKSSESFISPIIYSPAIGYRRHLAGDWMFRINYLIMIKSQKDLFMPWFGISFGKRF